MKPNSNNIKAVKGLFLVKEKKWKDNFSSFCLILIFLGVFLVTIFILFFLLLPWKLNFSAPFFCDFFYCYWGRGGGLWTPPFLLFTIRGVQSFFFFFLCFFNDVLLRELVFFRCDNPPFPTRWRWKRSNRWRRFRRRKKKINESSYCISRWHYVNERH